jgi:hypothetical protein
MACSSSRGSASVLDHQQVLQAYSCLIDWNSKLGDGGAESGMPTMSLTQHRNSQSEVNPRIEKTWLGEYVKVSDFRQREG